MVSLLISSGQDRLCVRVCARARVCVFACVCVWGGGREREKKMGERESGRVGERERLMSRKQGPT